MTDYDVQEIARLLSEGKSMTEIATALDGPTVDQVAADNRRQLQAARSGLNAESVSPGVEPTEDPIEGMVQAARRSGAPRGSDAYIREGVNRLFESAAAGDPRVVSEGTLTRETIEGWHRDAVQRQVANRDRSEFSPRR